MDRNDVGVREQWFTRDLPDVIELPGSLPAQGFGDNVTVDTKWTGGIVDRSWFTAPEYAKYRTPGNIKIPFWLQPEKYYAGVAWYGREINISKSWGGPADRSDTRAPALGNARLDRWPSCRHK